MSFPEGFQQGFKRDLFRVKHDQHYLVVTRQPGADFFISRVGRDPGRVPGSGDVHAVELPEDLFRAPETPEAEHRHLEILGVRALEGMTRYEMLFRRRDSSFAAWQGSLDRWHGSRFTEKHGNSPSSLGQSHADRGRRC